MSEIERVPPHAIDAEMAVLGSVLVDRSTWPVVADILKPGDFYAHRHETVFAAMGRLFDSDRPVDKVTLVDELRAAGQVERIGGIPYLSQLMETVPTAASAAFYARVVREKALLRGLIHAGGKIAALGYDAEDDVLGALEKADSYVREVSGRRVERIPPRSVAELNERIFRKIGERFEGVGETSQLTPWPTLNENTGGFCPGESVLWAGDAKAGKSGVVLCLADFVAAHYGTVAVFTNEMPPEDLVRRHNALYSGVSARRIRLGDLRGKDWEKLADAFEQTGGRPIVFFGFEVESLADIRREANRLKDEREDLAAIVIDHCGNISDADRDYGRTTKNERLSRVYKTLPRIAAETGTVVHGVQHINRAGAKGRPTKHDVRDGGNAEGHFNTIVLVHRPKPDGTADEREQGDFIVAACRDGVEGPVPARYIGARNLWLEANQTQPWFEIEAESFVQPTFEVVA